MNASKTLNHVTIIILMMSLNIKQHLSISVTLKVLQYISVWPDFVTMATNYRFLAQYMDSLVILTQLNYNI